MVTLQFDVDDETYAGLKARADQMGQPVEVLLATMAAREFREGSGVTEEFMADVRQVIKDYGPVLHRLAQ